MQYCDGVFRTLCPAGTGQHHCMNYAQVSNSPSHIMFYFASWVISLLWVTPMSVGPRTFHSSLDWSPKLAGFFHMVGVLEILWSFIIVYVLDFLTIDASLLLHSKSRLCMTALINTFWSTFINTWYVDAMMSVTLGCNIRLYLNETEWRINSASATKTIIGSDNGLSPIRH